MVEARGGVHSHRSGQQRAPSGAFASCKFGRQNSPFAAVQAPALRVHTMPQRGQTTALSSSASSSAPAATGPDGGWSAEPQPTAAVCTDESSGGDFEAQSREAVQPQAQQPLLMQWLASADSATQRHAAGVMAAVSCLCCCLLLSHTPSSAA